MKIYKISSECDFAAICSKIGASEAGTKIMVKKSNLNYFYLKDLRRPAANILKQDALSVGAELVTSRGTILGGEELEEALLVANPVQTEILAKKEAAQDFGLKELAKFLSFKFEIPAHPQIMGVLNFNSDSFNPQSRSNLNEATARVAKLIEDGADIVDIGAASSRPNSEYCGADEEFARIAPVIDALYREGLTKMAAFSLDSFDLKCQRYALEHGFSFVNDISANAALAALAGEFDATYCLMHGGKQGGANNSNLTCDIMGEVDEFFECKIAQCEAAGAKKIVLDIGVGFGKDAAQGLALIKNLSHFSRFEKPLLVGASRKSLINAYYPSEVSGRLAGTLFLHQKALENGAAIIRVHDVKEHAQMMKLSAAYHEILG